VNLPDRAGVRPEFSLVQIRPMSIGQRQEEVHIEADERHRAVIVSAQALGNGVLRHIADIVYVRPDAFDAARTVEIAGELGPLNGRLVAEGRRYLLLGPGRCGTADRWLGIPAAWNQVSGVGAVVETSLAGLSADPSQGSHFFHNITSLGIGYLTVTGGADRVDWPWLDAQPAAAETRHLRHLRLERPLTIKIDGKNGDAVVLAE